MRVLKQSTARSVEVFMTDSADHVTGKTGLTLTITESKDGAAFAGVSPTVTDLGTGWYKLALTSSHTDTLGDLALHITGAAADPADVVMQVVAYDPTDAVALGLSRLDAAISSVAAAVWAALTSALTTVGSIGKLLVTDIDATISSRAAAGASVTVSSPTATDSTLTVVRGDDYFAADSRSIDFTFTSAPVLTASTVKLSFRRDDRTTSDLTVTGSVLSATSLRFEPTAINTALLTPNVPYHYDVQATLASGHVCTLVRAVAVVQQDYTP